MGRRVVSAALVALAGAVWAPQAFAATAMMPPLKLASSPLVTPDRTSHITNFNLGGLLGPGLLQDASALRPAVTGASHGVQFELSRGRNWDPYADLFPA